MRSIVDFLYFVVIVFVAMIVGWFILGWLDRTFSGNIIGKGARTIEGLADPMG